MAYAEGRTFFDADSHIMEAPDWLQHYADPEMRDKLGTYTTIADENSPLTQKINAMIERSVARRNDPVATKQLEENVIASGKGWLAHGAMDSTERSRTLDLLGFDKQLVFATFALRQFLRSKDIDVVYGGARAHNRAMADFCADDQRMMGVGVVPYHDPERALDEAISAIDLGCEALWLPSDTATERSPAHADLEPLWAVLAEARVPIMLHIGGGRLLPRPYHNNGRPLPSDWLGGGENLRAKDYPVVHHSPERFLSCLVLDGVFERHPGLHCGVIELGASWVPGMLRNLDYAKRSFAKLEPLLKALPLDPSDYIRRQVRFTPFPFEDVGWLIEQAGEDLFLFSSDYPHPEGTRDPLGKFQTFLDTHQIGESAREKFYSGNFAHLMGL